MPKKNNPDLLTPMQGRFLNAYHGDAKEAIIAAGYKGKHAKQAGYTMSRIPKVQKAILAKQNAMVQESGKETARQVGISRSEVMEIAASIARSKKTTDSARVQAANLLAKILGMIVTKTEDVTKRYAGWTEEEMEYYAVTGEYPERIRSLLRNGEPGSLSGSPTTTTQS